MTPRPRAWTVHLVIGLSLLAVPSLAAPRTRPAAARQSALTPEMEKFAAEMATSFDGVYAQVADARRLESAGKLREAIAKWRGVYEGAKLLQQHALRAGAAGSFRDPMRFTTKAGTLTPATYLTELQKLQAMGDVGWAKAQVRDAQVRAERARVTYAAAIAAQVSSLETIARAAARTSKRAPEPARIALQNVARGAAALRASVTNPARRERAAGDATYPVKPRPLSATELAARLGQIEKDARAALAALPKPPAATPAGSPARPGTSQARAPAPTPARQPAASAVSPPAAASAPAVPACSPAGQINCDDTRLIAPCCEGSRCLPAGWVTDGGTDAEGFPTVDPDYYQCQDPDLAPRR